VERARASAQARLQRDPDFWSVVSLIEIDAFEAAGGNRLHAVLGSLLARADDLHSRAAAPKSWASVRDNAEYALRARLAHAAAAEKRALGDWLARLAAYAATGAGAG
jgi:hypothetical protein